MKVTNPPKYNPRGHKLWQWFIPLLLAFVQLGCLFAQSSGEPTGTAVPSTTQSQSEPQEPAQTTEAGPQPTEITPAESAKLFYNLPPAILVEATGLYASPNRGELIIPVQIRAGETVYVMGRNATSSHLRVVWSTGVGWIPVSFTDYNAARDKLDLLPVFGREPPACAVPLTTQFSLNSTWTSDDPGGQRIAVVVDVFRSRFGEFPASSLSLTVNGQEVESSRRQIVERGQFSLKDVVFSLPGYVQQGDVVGYLLQTTSEEPLAFMATIFTVPEDCHWKTD